MQKKLKKLLSLALAGAMMCSMGVTAFASEGDKTDYHLYRTGYKSTINLKNKIDKEVEILKKSNTRTGPGDWKTEYGVKQTKIAKGFAGNQPSRGMTFPTGGGFFHSDEGGPKVSVNFSCPKPYDAISVSVNLGDRGTSGYYVEAPDKVSAWKIYVEKTIEAQPYIVYTRNDVNSPWTVYYKGAVQEIVHVSPYAKKV